MKSLASHILLLALLALWPLATESVRFWQLEDPIEIKVQKDSPPYQAFRQVKGLVEKSAGGQIKYQKSELLMATPAAAKNIQSYKKIVLLEALVVKSLPYMAIQNRSLEVSDLDWLSTLPLRQRVRIEEAQSRYAILETDAKNNPKIKESDGNYKVSVLKTENGYAIKGPWEISGGLGLTNDHTVDLRRVVEGIPREAGQVSVKDGLYNISVDSMNGSLIAKMFDRNGQVVGEGAMLLSDGYLESGRAPKLIIRPHTNHFSGQARSLYDSGKNKTSYENLLACGLNCEAPFEKTSEGAFQIENFHSNSQTVARFSMPNFVATNTVVISGQEFSAPLFPKGMVGALREIVSEQIKYDLNNPDLPVIWGQVLLDGKSVPGAQVEIESVDGARVVYFDMINLPDTSLKETSANGYFAILGAPEGLHALIARRNGQYFAHNIVLAEGRTVAVSNLESTLKTRNVPVRAFDAFQGQPQAVDLELQSVEDPVHIGAEGWVSLLLPDVKRLSLIQLTPANSKYLPAQYFYSDNQEFIHLPLVSEEWLMETLQPKWNIIDSLKGTVIGFVQSEDFEVYLAGNPNFSPENITYFDSLGRPALEGVKGGGYIINNLDPLAHEIVVYGKASEKMYSRLLPIDERSISILNYSEN